MDLPTVVDRLLQQAVGQVIAIRFEMEFEDYSYGFRPNRNAQQAVLKAQEYIRITATVSAPIATPNKRY